MCSVCSYLESCLTFVSKLRCVAQTCVLRLTPLHLCTQSLTESRTIEMASAGAASPSLPVEERVQQHPTMLHRLGTAMDRVLQTMDRWERGGFPVNTTSSPPPAPQPTPMSTLPSSGPSGIRLSLPGVYHGTAAGCQGFLLQLELYLAAV